MVGRVAPNELELTEVHRFPNEPVRLPDGLHWDVLRLYRRGPRRPARGGRPRAADGLVSVGVDSWAVDYGLLDADGRLLGDPYHYRDGRTAAGVDGGPRRRPAGRLYARTGLQFLPFNTLYQLAAARGTAAFERRRGRCCSCPDLIGSWLSGAAVAERHQRLDHRPARRPSPGVGHWS